MRPFEGIRVLDLTHVFAGPFCTYQLAALGADVIKIEPRDNPDMTRSEGVSPASNASLYGTSFQSQNSGKRAIALNLKLAQGRDVMARLVKGADVLVQNYAGEALARLGFGYEAVRAINPTIIYCSLTGYGRTGPKAEHPAYDVVIQAFSGLMRANGTPDTTPVRVGPAMVDYGTGAQAAFAISAALFQRQQTGLGQEIDVAMLDAALMLMSSSVTDTLASGDPPEPHGNVHPAYPGYRSFETADGLLMLGAHTNEQLSRLLDVLGEGARALEVRQATRDVVREARDTYAAIIAAHLSTASADEWEARLNVARVPAARVRSLDETLAHAQIQSRSVMHDVVPQRPDGGTTKLPLAAFSYAHGTPAVDRPPPKFGEHSEAILAEVGYDQAQIEALRQADVI